VTLAAYRHLAGFSDFTSLLGTNSVFPFWLFQHNLHVVVESTSKEAAVLQVEGNWTSANNHNSARFPRLHLEVYSDPTRDANRNVVRTDAQDKALSVWEKADRHLHRPGGVDEFWTPLVRVIGSTRLDGEPTFSPLSDTDGVQVLSVYYALSVVV
jgi:hypothetical protein